MPILYAPPFSPKAAILKHGLVSALGCGLTQAYPRSKTSPMKRTPKEAPHLLFSGNPGSRRVTVFLLFVSAMATGQSSTSVSTKIAAALERVFAVNVTSTILCACGAVRRMSTRRGGTGGAIVNISSRAARTGAAGEWVHYAVSKGAIDSRTIGLAREVAGRNSSECGRSGIGGHRTACGER